MRSYTPAVAAERDEIRGPAEIRAYLRTAGEAIPDPLIAEAAGASSVVIESAEGVTTFGGFTQKSSQRRLKRLVAELDRKYPLHAK